MENSPPPMATSALPTRPSKRWLRVLVYVGIPYFTFFVLLVVFQRVLIYPATRTDRPLKAREFDLRDVVDVHLTASDQTQIAGWLFPPQSADQGAAELPRVTAQDRLLLFFHGNAGHRALRISECRELAALDCWVLQIDYRGYGDCPGSPSETGLADDARVAWDWAIANGWSPRQIWIFGESLGGAVACRLAGELADQKTEPAGLILGWTFDSLANVSSAKYPIYPVRWVLWDAWESAKQLAKVRCPLLQFHGDQDEIVPYRHGQQLFAAARDKPAIGPAKQFVTLTGRGHNDISYRSLRPQMARIV